MSDGDSIVSFGGLAPWKRAGGLLAGAVTRRWLSVALLAAVFVAVGSAAALLLPKMYSAQGSLLIKKNYTMPALANPKRAVPIPYESPGLNASVEVLSHRSLEHMVHEKGMIEAWDRDRSAVLRFKDRLSERLRGPIPESEKIEALIDLLAKRMTVTLQDDMITVKVSWSTPEMARDLVNSGMAAFLDSKRSIEVQTIADTYTILKTQADLERDRVENRLASVGEVRRAATPPRTPVATVRKTDPDAAPRPDEAMTELRTKTSAARVARLAAERQHQNKVADVETRLAERRAVATDRHPDVVALQMTLARLRPDPPGVVEARAEERRLLADYQAGGGSVDDLTSRIGESETRLAAAPGLRLASGDGQPGPATNEKAGEDDATLYARSQFKGALESYQELLDRLHNVEIELHTAEAAFGYRYTIESPARLPKRADSPNVPLIVIGSVLAGLLAGLTRAVFKQLQDLSLLSPATLVQHLTSPDARGSAS
ncbi:MAG: hypothetical protein WCP29_01120 [Acidobacteriota bacterium]